MARVKIQITTPSNNVIKVSPGVSALSSVQLYLNELIDVNTQHGADGYVLTQQADGTFAMEAVATTLADLSDTDISNPQGGDSLVYDADAQKWVPGGVKSVNGQEGDVIISIPSPPPTPGVSGLADTNITNLQGNQIIRYDSVSGDWLNEDLEALPSGGTTGQALVKASNTDYDVAWDDIAVDVQFHQRYATEAETLRSGATETVELYFFAQGDGNGLAESASSDTPTSGYDIQRKLYYAEKAQADPDTSADWTQFTAIADNTTFANAKAALLAYLKDRTGGTVPISLKMTWEEVAQAPAFTGLLNESYGSGAEAAYSTRRLNGNVTDCMVIRRASDSTTTTIGFVDGDIDEAAIETFCTGTTCTVYQWLDQSGNGNDATAAAPANEPTIYTGGALVKENGKVALDFDVTNDILIIPNATSLQIVGDLYFANVLATEGILLSPFFTKRVDDNNREFEFRNSSSTQFSYLDSANRKDFSIGATSSRQLYSVNRISNLSVNFNLDGYSYAALSLTGTQAATTADVAIGARVDLTQRFDGRMQEILLYASNKSSVRTSIESNIGDYFTQNTPLLDTYSGAAAAYSLRLLDSTYTGSAVEVYNGSSYADIGFNVFGELDTVALAAHCGSNNGFVSKWYDQSGNTNTAAQTTTAYMPKIYDGTTGVVTDTQSKPALYFSGGQQLTTGTMTAAIQPVTAISFVDTTNSPVQAGWFYSLGQSQYAAIQDDGSRARMYAGSSFVVGGAGSGANTRRLDFSLFDGANSEIYLNSISRLTGNPGPRGITSIRIGGLNNPNFNGFFGELIAYPSDQSSNRTNIEDNINTFYSIY